MEREKAEDEESEQEDENRGLNPGLGDDERTHAVLVLGPDHETHEVQSLYVCDGSAIPSSLGVNPQITIMALAKRVARLIG